MSSRLPRTLEDAMLAIAAAQDRATASGISLHQPPPTPTTCCGRGCAGCVWESYFDAVGWWLEDARQD
ncbi:oxidoreductase-like domain-containing protein [Ramlibacter tataouinensis]|uniref:oxidoreductase-like domain-containing protein n=1 Tax=Ramlibacter tataouinensis TaxID=94132 RepID=UPI0022F3BC4E|nr:oxidoreductase-like domain-containing protein [Ramlibacter tataouinensis]WBY03118.1 oxidoreductase-like domain-containing protein [Ramlibacter tataouinensis]